MLTLALAWKLIRSWLFSPFVLFIIALLLFLLLMMFLYTLIRLIFGVLKWAF